MPYTVLLKLSSYCFPYLSVNLLEKGPNFLVMHLLTFGKHLLNEQISYVLVTRPAIIYLNIIMNL